MKIRSLVLTKIGGLGIVPGKLYEIIEFDSSNKYVKLSNYDDKWYNVNDLEAASQETEFYYDLVSNIQEWRDALQRDPSKENICEVISEMDKQLSMSKDYL